MFFVGYAEKNKGLIEFEELFVLFNEAFLLSERYLICCIHYPKPDNTKTERIHRLRMFKTPSLNAPVSKWQNWGRIMANGERSNELLRLNVDEYNLYGITFSQEGDGFKIMGFDSDKLDLTEEISFKNEVLDDPDFSQQLESKFKNIGSANIGHCRP